MLCSTAATSPHPQPSTPPTGTGAGHPSVYTPVQHFHASTTPQGKQPQSVLREETDGQRSPKGDQELGSAAAVDHLSLMSVCVSSDYAKMRLCSVHVHADARDVWHNFATLLSRAEWLALLGRWPHCRRSHVQYCSESSPVDTDSTAGAELTPTSWLTPATYNL